jgi:hypothetical protein
MLMKKSWKKPRDKAEQSYHFALPRRQIEVCAEAAAWAHVELLQSRTLQEKTHEELLIV